MIFSKFTCCHCGKEITSNKKSGVQNRNHCPYCLYSVHLDLSIPGDRKSSCGGEMVPIGLAFKRIKPDKYKKEDLGELMLIHQCRKCGKISINRIAGDDDPKEILKIFHKSFRLPLKIRKKLEKLKIKIAKREDLEKIETQLFGKL
jgi:DNA-directed RNA polymerase subunit RPC12/RpoP